MTITPDFITKKVGENIRWVKMNYEEYVAIDADGQPIHDTKGYLVIRRIKSDVNKLQEGKK